MSQFGHPGNEEHSEQWREVWFKCSCQTSSSLFPVPTSGLFHTTHPSTFKSDCFPLFPYAAWAPAVRAQERNSLLSVPVSDVKIVPCIQEDQLQETSTQPQNRACSLWNGAYSDTQLCSSRLYPLQKESFREFYFKLLTHPFWPCANGYFQRPASRPNWGRFSVTPKGTSGPTVISSTPNIKFQL